MHDFCNHFNLVNKLVCAAAVDACNMEHEGNHSRLQFSSIMGIDEFYRYAIV